MQGFDPAAHAPDLLLHVKGRDVAPDRGLGCAGQIAQVDDRHHRPILDGGQNDPVAFLFVHRFLPERNAAEILARRQSKTITLESFCDAA
jgi:hypothetical protein